jgi:hypothetical protein
VSKRRGSHVVGVGLVLGLIAACSIGDVDVSNKACPCGPDYVCDAARNLCVTPQELAGIGTDGGGDAGEDGAPVCTTDVCPCTTDIECKDPERPRCSAEKLCVECVRTPDSCPAGSYCNAESQCTLGCKAESDCQISPVAPPKLSSEGKDNKPFYASPWLWGAIGAAVLIGGFFYFASQDTSSDPIHLQMRVPR